ncbi:MAG: B12-binding domain-containing protein, partial [Limisphaerales bacterium]
MSAATLTIREEIESQRNHIADQVVARCFELKPELDQRYGPIGRKKCHEDTIYHLRYLSDAVSSDSPSLFVSYVGWAKVLLAGYKIPAGDLEFHLQLLRESLKTYLTEQNYILTGSVIQQALDALPDQPDELTSVLDPSEPHHFLAREYLARLLEGNRREASSMIMTAVQSGVSVKDIYVHVFQRAQHEIGRLWQSNQLSVAQEHFCT